MKTLGEIEAGICEGMTRLEQQYMGRGPKDIHAHLIGDLLVVRLRGVLTAVEQQLAKSLPAEKGRDLLKEVRTHLIETARSVLEAMVHEVAGANVLSLHHDISSVTGEQVLLFTLAGSPPFRERKIKSTNDQGPGEENLPAAPHHERRTPGALLPGAAVLSPQGSLLPP